MLQTILNRLTALERPKALRVGPTSGITPVVAADNTGFTVSVDSLGNLVVISDRGIMTVVAPG